MAKPKRLKRDQIVNVRAPFVVVVDPDFDNDGLFSTRLIGRELDNSTQGVSPANALWMAWDLLCVLTGLCTESFIDASSQGTECDWSIETENYRDGETISGRTCSRCGAFLSNELLEDDPT